MPKKRVLPFIILGIINGQPKITGREVTAEFSTEIGDFWKASHSQIYPELRRMVNDGWIKVSTSSDNAKEKYYEITAAGKKTLDDWLNQLVTELPVHEDLFSLKLFFIKDMNDKRIPELISQQLVLLKKELNYLGHRRQKLFTDDTMIQNNYGHYLILMRAISRTQGQIQWLEEVQKQLEEK
ncbi:PadR family transcriptional regulator [Limosilactobacillus sp. RRLNB_1_1]|uniref:PadR family transcriptional regulator n=1 Tax=Limosilactobacillus albertensis TaxID=2759752 RepID=A0A7W3TSB8_9LACO|nr:PadR family transcriptional regulator [Limosilactobacillus albertensis]MBB1069984.1 PadR family transcriptional regulator [Limosilactobacillus albertensis]MCD7117221.1 PadR family transcriptional regulator [Limosilactobacillus albertensis]MCD7128825.1 PadR family transcriptional regulator [Limosilactobacillus albertensis]